MPKLLWIDEFLGEPPKSQASPVDGKLTAPVPVEPDVGTPLFCQTPFLEKYTFKFVISKATPRISPFVKDAP